MPEMPKILRDPITLGLHENTGGGEEEIEPKPDPVSPQPTSPVRDVSYPEPVPEPSKRPWEDWQPPETWLPDWLDWLDDLMDGPISPTGQFSDPWGLDFKWNF
jgi:hypothetical protein